jgi:hypothetical protein
MKEYIPTILRKVDILPRPERWGVGISDGKSGVGMTDGPFETELEALETVGQPGSEVYHFLPDGTCLVTWHWEVDRWISHKKEE